MKKIFTILLLFVFWIASDYAIHCNLLQKYYKESQDLWRPMNEMNLPLIYGSSLIYCMLFFCFYWHFSQEKSIASGMKFGLALGLITGMGQFMCYFYMPIDINLAGGWFLGSLTQCALGGTLIGYLTKDGEIA